MKVNDIIKKGVTEKYDGIMSVTDFKLNENNITMYGKYEENHISNIQKSIVKDGLKNPIVVYDDGKTIKSGHNRYFAIKKLGILKAPFNVSEESKPESELDEMISLAIENMGRPANMGRSYTSVVKMSEIYSTENEGKTPKKEIERFCSFHQISYDSYSKISTLEVKHPDLFDAVLSGSQSLNSAWNAKKMRERSSGVTLNQTPFMNGLLSTKEINYGIATVVAVRNQIDSMMISKPGGFQSKAFDDIQKNIIGGIVHEIFTNAIRDIVNYEKGDGTLIAPKNMGLYDLEAEMHQSGIETKTAVTKTGSKPQFVGHRYKDGYHVLLSITPTGNRAFAGYGVIPKECWKDGLQNRILDINKLYSIDTFDVFMGSLEEEDEKVVVYHDKITV